MAGDGPPDFEAMRLNSRTSVTCLTRISQDLGEYIRSNHIVTTEIGKVANLEMAQIFQRLDTIDRGVQTIQRDQSRLTTGVQDMRREQRLTSASMKNLVVVLRYQAHK